MTPNLHLKAAALLHPPAGNHPLVDIVVAVAAGTLDDLEKIAVRLAAWSPGR